MENPVTANHLEPLSQHFVLVITLLQGQRSAVPPIQKTSPQDPRTLIYDVDNAAFQGRAQSL